MSSKEAVLTRLPAPPASSDKEGRTPKDIDTYAYLDHAPQTLLMVDWDLDLDRYVLSNQVPCASPTAPQRHS